jgi:hypothetical protein
MTFCGILIIGPPPPPTAHPWERVIDERTFLGIFSLRVIYTISSLAPGGKVLGNEIS